MRKSGRMRTSGWNRDVECWYSDPETTKARAVMTTARFLSTFDLHRRFDLGAHASCISRTRETNVMTLPTT